MTGKHPDPAASSPSAFKSPVAIRSVGVTPGVYTIPAGSPFVDALADGLAALAGDVPQRLAAMTVLLPNRRACRSLAEAFLRRATVQGSLAPAGAVLLPRLLPIGEIDEDADAILSAAEGGADFLDLLPAIGPLRRQALLARLIMKKDGAMVLDQALQLAGELARLLDQAETERRDFADIKNLFPEAYAQHWQDAVKFLDLLLENWPAILAQENVVDPARRRNLLLERQCALWRERPPAGPVIAAGSTGSIPASADLMVLIAGLPQGYVVLPGLDQSMEAPVWEAVANDPGHPQFGLNQLLARLNLARSAVRVWPFPAAQVSAPYDAPLRARLVSCALYPAAATSRWSDLAQAIGAADAARGFQGVQRIDAQSQQEEAQAIALILREAVARQPPIRAALVTPDRALARRVAAELGRWDIRIDDSAGLPLAMTPPGAFFLQLAEAAAARWAPVPLLALLKHPLAAAGNDPQDFRAAIRAFERHALRGLRPAPGLLGLQAILAAPGMQPRPLLEHLIARITPLLSRLDVAEDLTPVDWLERHAAAAEALAATSDTSGAARLWAGDAGQALADFVHGMHAALQGFAPVHAADYAGMLMTLIGGVTVRPRYGLHPRLFIWGPLEARLQQADVVVLGGLNEGTWPGEASLDPWLNRPMRQQFGLPAPERKVGLAAHDFQQALGAPEVILTRSMRVDGVPAAPSRWLLRLDAFRRCFGTALAAYPDTPWLHWCRSLDRPAHVAMLGRPRPRPGSGYRPRRLSVTRIETWMRDPYSIYARYILNLQALSPLDQDPGAADLGQFIHAALDAFVKDYPRALPQDAHAKLLAIGRAAFAPLAARPAAWAFWWPRFERAAAWFIGEEARRRPRLAEVLSEVESAFTIPTADPPFTLTAKADRLELYADGTLAIVDYKTGTLPRMVDVHAGLSPQLPLEAALAAQGGFASLGKRSVVALEFWRLGGVEGGAVAPVKDRKSRKVADPAMLADAAYRGLCDLIAYYGREDAEYPAMPRLESAPRYSDYQHLARWREWASADDDEGCES